MNTEQLPDSIAAVVSLTNSAVQKSNKFIRKSRHSKRKERNTYSTTRLREIRYTKQDLICPICLEYICCSVSVSCGHTFCEMCFVEYELIFDTCLVCNSSIRNSDVKQSFLLDNLIHDFISRNHPADLHSYNARQHIRNVYRQKRHITSFFIGQKIDIRDPSHVWCSGIVTKMYPHHNNSTYHILVTYLQSHHNQENIPSNSPRLAPFQFFTARQNIPHYDNQRFPSSSLCHTCTSVNTV